MHVMVDDAQHGSHHTVVANDTPFSLLTSFLLCFHFSIHFPVSCEFISPIYAICVVIN